MSFYISSPSSSMVTQVSSHTARAVLQPRRNSLTSDHPNALKREKHVENVHSESIKKPKRAGKYYRKKDQRVSNSSNFLPSTTGANQLQSPQGRLVAHRPSITGFDSFSLISLFPLSSASQTFSFPAADVPSGMSDEVTSAHRAQARHTHPSSLSNSRTRFPHTAVAMQNEAKHQLSPALRRFSLPPAQSNSTPQPLRIAYSTSRPPSPVLDLPPIPKMPSQDVDLLTRQQILDETVAINKELLERFGRESRQNVREILLNNVVERNKLINNLTNDIRSRLNPRTFIWPETQYPFCIIITEDEDDFA